jgi:hypothetical protein
MSPKCLHGDNFKAFNRARIARNPVPAVPVWSGFLGVEGYGHGDIVETSICK